jgi:SAM-dependent methyltransferase
MMRVCPCCGSTEFSSNDILWDGLIKEWQLKPAEADYINRQQGYTCQGCGSNLRTMSLAYAITQLYGQPFNKFLKSRLKVLEINEACYLHPFLQKMKNHQIVEYPAVDMMKLPLPNKTFDLVIHSDTLEHVADPVRGLKENLRVLKPGGYTLFTIPIVVGRLSQKRGAKKPSYHGSPGNKEYLVHTEYGADMWTQLFEAGFSECRLISADYPASIAVIGRKPELAGPQNG